MKVLTTFTPSSLSARYAVSIRSSGSRTAGLCKPKGRRIAFASFRGFTSSDNCVLTFQKPGVPDCLGGRKARAAVRLPGSTAHPEVFLIVTQVSCSNFIHLPHCSGT
ncbi:hypothetical protein P5V15_013507 [Pogonomyrmex californicus]